MSQNERLISAEKAYEMGHRTPFHIGIADLCDLKELLADVPTVDAVEVVHGRWENIRFITTGDGRARIGDCSSCKSIERVRNYCPNCGAKMDGGNEDA